MTFLPNIFILFLALAFLEDSGYMARVAYVMDGIMGRIGLSGRAFIPMILGFGCSVPAVMASRALEDNNVSHAFYVMQRKASNLHFVFADVFWETCNDSSLLNVCHWVSCCCFCCFYSSYCR